MFEEAAFTGGFFHFSQSSYSFTRISTARNREEFKTARLP
jgi:hypothetical protein